MKTINYFIVFTIALIFLSSCENDDTTEDNKQAVKSESVLLMKKSSTVEIPSNQEDFTIEYAGVYQDMLYLGLLYQGGEKAHEFKVSWDGETRKVDQKDIIELFVAHLTADDEGIESIADSLAASLTSLGISTENLSNENLWFKVVNSANTSNQFLFLKSVPSNSNLDNNRGDLGNTNSILELTASVVKVECSSEGIWGNLWLKGINNDFYVVKGIDQSINYSPLKDDQLKLEYKYTVMDSLNVCDQVNSLGAAAIIINKLEKKN